MGSETGRCGLHHRDRCANCDAHIDRRDWHPVAAPPDDRGDGVYAFCGWPCRETWVARRDSR